jgi:hypothetical protein
MKIPKELYNGIIIWIGLVFIPNNEGFKPCGFILSQALNILFIYWRKQNVKSNYKEGKTNFPANATSALVTALIGVFISIIGLVFYSIFRW